MYIKSKIVNLDEKVQPFYENFDSFKIFNVSTFHAEEGASLTHINANAIQ